MKNHTKLLIIYVYFQPNCCNTHAEGEWVRGTFLRQWRKVPPAHAQQVYLEERSEGSPHWVSVPPYKRLSGSETHAGGKVRIGKLDATSAQSRRVVMPFGN
jgi:hypothetical protein